MKSTLGMLLGLALAAILVMPSPVAAQSYSVGDARSDVGQLRNMYGVATDLLARDGAGDFERALEIYERIFTDDVCIAFAPGDPGQGCFQGIAGISGPTGVSGAPEAWADFVSWALAPSLGTQHLLGSQVVAIDELPRGNPGTSNSTGHATMSTYLQAWQVFPTDPPEEGKGDLSLYIGTYFDLAEVTRGVGWQIYDMRLIRNPNGSGGESRVINTP